MGLFKYQNLRKCKINGFGPSYEWNSVSSDNLGQKVEDKLTKLSKMCFSLKCFRADFLSFFTKRQGFSGNFLIS